MGKKKQVEKQVEEEKPSSSTETETSSSTSTEVSTELAPAPPPQRTLNDIQERIEKELQTEGQPKKPQKKSLGLLFVRIYFWFHIHWILFHTFIYKYLHDVSPDAQAEEEKKLQQQQQGQQPKPSSGATKKKPRKLKKFLHIGDEIALGVGDWVTYLGDAGLNHYINIQPPLLISKWIKIAEGRRGSTTEDWLPGSAVFEEFFHPDSGKHVNANIIMITLGSNDVCTPASTAENLKAIVTTLRQRLPTVHLILNIPYIPPSVRRRDDDSKVKQRVLLRNDLMRDAIKHLIINDEYAQLMEEVAAGAETTTDAKSKSIHDKEEEKINVEASKLKNMSATEIAKKSLYELSKQGYIRFGIDLDEMFGHLSESFCLGELFLKPRSYKDAVSRVLGETIAMTQRAAERDDLTKLLQKTQ